MKLEHEKLLSAFAFYFNLRHYTTAGAVRSTYTPNPTAVLEQTTPNPGRAWQILLATSNKQTIMTFKDKSTFENKSVWYLPDFYPDLAVGLKVILSTNGTRVKV